VVTAYVGLGSNLDHPPRQIALAIAALKNEPGIRSLRVSSCYRNPPFDGSEQPDYCNAVAGLETTLKARELFAACQRIEQAQGRIRDAVRWGPRPLDLDLLLYGDCVSQVPELILPHPGLAQRPFVLYPLLELDPDLVVPGWGPVSELAARCDGSQLERIPLDGSSLT
jgi:2-amino-4-hydroxy-6-hydroxymethyldihydropteridine diphosphokinase